MSDNKAEEHDIPKKEDVNKSIQTRSSDKQKEHLKYAREQKAKKREIKLEQEKLYYDQLKSIYNHLSGLNNRMDVVNENVGSLMKLYEPVKVAEKRKKPESDEEKTEEFADNKKQKTEEETEDANKNHSYLPIGIPSLGNVSHFMFKTGAIAAAVLALYGYKQYREKNDPPRKRYRDLKE